MPFGMINDTTAVTLQNITDIANVTSPEGFFINVNHIVFNGYLYFSLLWVAWIIFFFIGQYMKDQPLNNMMYSGAIITMISFILRSITYEKGGVIYGMLSDKQMWLFPLITILIATFIWITKE